jgi:RND family efflux transporter MFP subunit
VTTQELNLSFTRVVAPLAGRVSWRRLAVGNIVTADTTPLTTIVSLDPIRFLFDAPESALLRYRREAGGTARSSVEIRLQDEQEYRWKGEVDFLDNALDRSSGTIRGRATIANPDGFISPGMFGQMRLFAGKAFDALLVPDQAIVTDQTRQVVYVVDAEGTIAQKVVEPGRLIEGLRVIREGLDPQDRVVISGVQRARPGRKVSVTEGTVTAFPTGVSRGEDSTLSMPSGGGR